MLSIDIINRIYYFVSKGKKKDRNRFETVCKPYLYKIYRRKIQITRKFKNKLSMVYTENGFLKFFEWYCIKYLHNMCHFHAKSDGIYKDYVIKYFEDSSKIMEYSNILFIYRKYIYRYKEIKKKIYLHENKIYYEGTNYYIGNYKKYLVRTVLYYDPNNFRIIYDNYKYDNLLQNNFYDNY
jgi:hypothetical protein